MNTVPLSTWVRCLVWATLLLTACREKPAVFRAFADGLMAWWSLNLYEDQTFDMHLAAGDYCGTYAREADTIWLAYIGVIPANGPQGVLVDRQRGIVTGLRVDSLSSALVADSSMWMPITEDRLPDQ